MKLEHNFRHILYIPVRFADLDAMGHVNNSRYLTFYEEARSAWFRDCVGMPADSTAFPVIVARVELDFVMPITPGQNVYVATRCVEMGHKSMILEGKISTDAAMQKIVSRYKCILVHYDYKKSISTPLPDAFKRKVEHYESGN